MPAKSRRPTLGSVLVRYTANVGLAAVPIALLVLVGGWAAHDGVALDYQHAFRPAAHALLHGRSPYPADEGLAASLGGARAYIYPPLVAYLAAPLQLLPAAAAGWLVWCLSLLCVPAALLLLGVRDWRCHAIALSSPPALVAVQYGTVTPPLLLAVAVFWRFRGRVGLAAIALAAAAKVFLWPLLAWQARYRTQGALVGSLLATLFVLVPWAASGFAGFAAYPGLLRRVSAIEGPRSVSPASALYRLGLDWPEASAVALLVGLLLVVAAAFAREPRIAFAAAIVAALVGSPLVWPHYLSLTFAAIAVFQPRLGAAWLLTLGFWLAPGASMQHAWTWWAVMVVPIAALAVVVAARPESARLRPSTDRPLLAANERVS